MIKLQHNYIKLNIMKTQLLSKLSIPLILVTLLLNSCKKDSNNPIVFTSMDQLEVSDEFQYRMTEDYSITISTQDYKGTPLRKVRIEIYNNFDEVSNSGDLILTGVSNDQGLFESQFNYDLISEQIFIVCRYVGLPTVSEFTLSGNSLYAVIGGPVMKSNLKGSFSLNQIAANYSFLCSYNSSGVPSCLVIPGDTIDAALLADINNALPESAPVPQYNSHYLAEGNETDIRILEEADVWITFVHEGAGHKNAIGFYTYDVENPPATKHDIDSIIIAFPNLSYHNSGGGLYSGDKVYLGAFPEGTGIGWVLIANGYTGINLNTNASHFYSNPDFNPETNPALRQHNVLLYDPERELYLIGFEDINRERGSCDNDFNDAIFYVTSNPIEAIQSISIPLVNPNLMDTDGDGIVDAMDDYPNDSTKAFNNYYPSRLERGGLAFEDLWPEIGDYDFNDLVLSYHINQITNAQNLVAEIEATFIVEAIGAGFKNGFGFELKVSPSAIKNVSGMSLQENIITLSPNNTEANQAKAVIIAFDNAYNMFADISSGFVNTRTTMPYIQPDSVKIIIQLNEPKSTSELGLPPYNPFLIVDKERGREVHLPGYPPSSLANSAYFGTFDDDTQIAQEKYYKTITNLPWAMHTPIKFDYPLERAPIVQAHLTFGQWVQSSGFSYMDWYKNKANYRDIEKIYPKPN